MSLSHAQQALAVARLRIFPLATSSISAIFSYLTHEYVAGFKHRDVSYEARSAVVPGWWDHIRAQTALIRLGSFSSTFIFALLNTYPSTLAGFLGDGTKGKVGPLAGNLYLIGGLLSECLTLFYHFDKFPVYCVLACSAPRMKRNTVNRVPANVRENHLGMFYFVQTVIRQFVPLQLNVLMVAKEPAAKREAGLDKFLRIDYVRGWTKSYPAWAFIFAATMVWVADQL